MLDLCRRKWIQKGRTGKKHKRIFEIPLDSERKRMTTVNQFNGERYVLTKGAPEIIIEQCKNIEDEGKCSEITEDNTKENTRKY